MYGYREQQQSPPVREGEELDVKIEAVGEKGDGVAKKDGFVLFVPNVKEGDEVRIRITKVLRKVGFAESIGKAQGPIATSSPPPGRSQAEVQAHEREQIAAKASQMESTEDFGEEESDDEAVDDTVEEPAEEPLDDVESDEFKADEPADDEFEADEDDENKNE